MTVVACGSAAAAGGGSAAALAGGSTAVVGSVSRAARTSSADWKRSSGCLARSLSRKAS